MSNYGESATIKTPEVGDVFENGFYRAVVLQIYYKQVCYMVKDSRCKFRQYKKRSPKDFLSRYKTYLGKSKANINDLFKTENEE